MNVIKLSSYVLLIFMTYFPTSNSGKLGGRKRFRTTTTTVAPTTPVPIPTSPADVVRQRMGGNVRLTKYNNQLYKGEDGGPVDTGDDLQCNFDGVCCWDNVASPTDQFDWMIGVGSPDPVLFQNNFGTSSRPSGKYLIVAEPRSSATYEAMYVSCTVTCSSRPIQIKFRHWTTPGVQLQVCSSDTFFNDHNQIQLINCKDVKRSFSSNPTNITIPPGDFVDIVFVASNFRNNYGGVAIIDNVNVDITPCMNKHPEGGKTTPSVHRTSH